MRLKWVGLRQVGSMNWGLWRGIRYGSHPPPPLGLALFCDGLLTAGAVGGYFLYVFGMGSEVMVVLQQSLALASVLSLGHLGTTELGGNIHTIVSLSH
jgi:hypothetical protein